MSEALASSLIRMGRFPMQQKGGAIVGTPKVVDQRVGGEKKEALK